MALAILKLAPHADSKLASEALVKRQKADYQCYLTLEKHYHEIVAALQLARQHGLDDEKGDTIIADLKEAINERRCANDRFLESLAQGESIKTEL